jgi:hypothetical protein
MPKAVKLQTLIFALAGVLLLSCGLFYFFFSFFIPYRPESSNITHDVAESRDRGFRFTKNEQTPPGTAPPTESKQISTATEESTQNIPKTGQKIIKTATLRYKVNDYHKSRSAIIALIKKGQAYLASEEEYNGDDSIQSNMTIRVPISRFDTLLDSLVKESSRLENKTVQAQDVTAEFIDTEARLKAKKAVEQRYFAILNQAHSIKDILEIETQLGTIRESIESTEGQLKYLNDQVMYSTISLTFYQSIKRLPRPESGFWYNIGAAFIKGWDVLLSIIIGAIYIWPFLIITAFLVLVYRNYKKKSRSN